MNLPQHVVKRWLPALAASAAVPAVVALAGTGVAGASQPSVIYNAIPNRLPPNVPSLGFEATSTSEFGDQINLAGKARTLDAVTVTFSDWALHSGYPAMSAKGWKWPITINVYSAIAGTPNKVGKKLASVTQAIAL